MSRTYLGLDLGGTIYKYGLVTTDGRIIARGQAETKSDRGPDHILPEIADHLNGLIARRPSAERPSGLAIGAAAFIDQKQGVLVKAPNLPGWDGLPLAARLSAATGLEVRLENDANLFTLGEWLAGAGMGLNNLIGLTLGTGVGGGLILDGRLWNGSFGTAAEIGHVIVEPDGRRCGCGGYGCLETISSATAMVRTAVEWISQGKPCLYNGKVDELTALDLHNLAKAGDQLALDVFARAGWALGLALTSVFNLLGLEGTIIGGGAAKAFEFIRPRLADEFSKRVLAVDPRKVVIRPATLGDDAPLIGAPCLFADQLV